MADTDILVSELPSASQVNTTDLVMLTQVDAGSETGYSTKKGTNLDVFNKALKGTTYSTDLPSFTTKNVLGGMEELKSDLTALLPVDSAGPSPIASFNTGMALPLVDCKVNVLATGGNGTPDNPIAINGYTEANITRCGVNLFDNDKLVIASYPYPSMTFDKGTFLKAGTYTASISNVENASSWRFGYRFFNSDGTIITSAITNGLVSFTSGTAFLDAYDSNQTCLQASDNTETSVKFTLTKDTYIVGCISNGNVGASTTLDYQIETGSSATSYHAYNGNTYTIAFGQTVYGGVLDVTRGKLTVTTARLDLSDLNYSYNTTAGVAPYFYASISGVKYEGPFFSTVYNSKCNIYTCTKRDGPAFVDKTYCFDGSAPTVSQIQIKDLDYTDAVAFKASLSGAYIIYELATPFDIDLTPEVISAIVGANNVFADCGGDTSVQFKDSIQNYIDKKIAQTQALIL